MDIKQHTTNNQWVKEEITRDNRACLETNENKNTEYQNLQDAARNCKRETFKAINREFPGGPVAETLCSRYRGAGLDPWSGD